MVEPGVSRCSRLSLDDCKVLVGTMKKWTSFPYWNFTFPCSVFMCLNADFLLSPSFAVAVVAG